MRCIRIFRGFNRTRNSNKDVLTDMGCEDPRQIVLKEAAKYVHRIVTLEEPSSIFKLIRKPTWRKEGDITIRHFPLSAKTKRNMLLYGVKLYNTLPVELRTLTPKRMKRELLKWQLYDLPVNPQVPITKAKKIRQ